MKKLLPAVLAAALLPLSGIGGTAVLPAAEAAPTASVVAVEPAGHTYGGASLLTTPNGTSLLTWQDRYVDAGGHTVEIPQLRRQVGTGSWATVTLARDFGPGVLDRVGRPQLMWDPATSRVILEANAASNADNLYGHYIWYSSDNGATWTGPVMVHDNAWSNTDASPDGAGGFYFTPNNIDALQVHVGSAYPTLGYDDNYHLTPRLSSRGDNNLTTAGPSYNPLYFFNTGDGTWVHPGTQNDGTQDRLLFTCQYGMHAAGDTTGAIVEAEINYCGKTGLAFRGVQPTGATSVASGPVRYLTTANVGRHAVRTTPGAPGSFALVWSQDDMVWSARVTGGPNGAVAKQEVFNLAAHGMSYYTTDTIDVSRTWVVGLSDRNSDNRSVVWATRNTPVGPTVGLPAAERYKKSTGKASYSVTTNSGSWVTAILKAKLGRTVRSTRVRFHVSTAGTVARTQAATAAMRRILRKKGAVLTLKVISNNGSGSVSRSTKVAIRR